MRIVMRCLVIRVETLELVSRHIDGLAVAGVAVGLKQPSPWPWPSIFTSRVETKDCGQVYLLPETHPVEATGMVLHAVVQGSSARHVYTPPGPRSLAIVVADVQGVPVDLSFQSRVGRFVIRDNTV
jgi:hypothetical protein